MSVEVTSLSLAPECPWTQPTAELIYGEFAGITAPDAADIELLRTRGAHYYGLTEEDRLLGAAAVLYPPYSTDATLELLVVDSRYRYREGGQGKGYGRILLREIEVVAANRAASFMHVGALAESVGFFARQGYVADDVNSRQMRKALVGA